MWRADFEENPGSRIDFDYYWDDKIDGFSISLSDCRRNGDDQPSVTGQDSPLAIGSVSDIV